MRIELNQTVNKLEAERKLQTELREKLGDSDRKMSGKNSQGQLLSNEVVF